MVYHEKIMEEPLKKQLESKQKNYKNDLKVLIVEDDYACERFMKIVIKDFCKTILIARTGNEAVMIGRKHPDLDLVLMDVLLPDINGYETTRQIRQFNKSLVIIAQTAYASPEDRDKAIEAGCNDYIAKPYSKTQLQELLQKHFQNN